ncbi:hypothetical protein BpHYR1_035371 [Brachionus plicatilis]|uniref:Uncharacterized protein n=1 Tax=Brachionus plicatilis TaxID=10195 RepID=A0A3M7S8E3_BRAPC|nr:hypothetical protein BpHYR1_035371 [Brachionus plicatilis]
MYKLVNQQASSLISRKFFNYTIEGKINANLTRGFLKSTCFILKKFKKLSFYFAFSFLPIFTVVLKSQVTSLVGKTQSMAKVSYHSYFGFLYVDFKFVFKF